MDKYVKPSQLESFIRQLLQNDIDSETRLQEIINALESNLQGVIDVANSEINTLKTKVQTLENENTTLKNKVKDMYNKSEVDVKITELEGKIPQLGEATQDELDAMYLNTYQKVYGEGKVPPGMTIESIPDEEINATYNQIYQKVFGN